MEENLKKALEKLEELFEEEEYDSIDVDYCTTCCNTSGGGIGPSTTPGT